MCKAEFWLAIESLKVLNPDVQNFPSLRCDQSMSDRSDHFPLHIVQTGLTYCSCCPTVVVVPARNCQVDCESVNYCCHQIQSHSTTVETQRLKKTETHSE